MRNKKIIIRADGNAHIGAGHLMRCLTIADGFLDRTNVGFLCADEDSAALVADRGYEAYVLGTDYRDMEAELPAWERLFAGLDRVILADSYYITNPYLIGLHKYGKVAVLDDMAKIAWNADAVINYNVFAHQEMYEDLQPPYKSRYYTGAEFIPIRREFCGRNYTVQEKVENILITTGGGDQENIAGQILERIHSSNCQYHVVTGRFNPHYDSLVQLAKEHQNIRIYHDVRDMASLMEECDLAVTAGGTTIYELSAIGVPFVCFSYAENQEKLTEYIGRNDIAGYGGAFHMAPKQTLVSIKEQVNILTENCDLRLRCSKAEQQMVDGQGATRIARVLKDLLK